MRSIIYLLILILLAPLPIFAQVADKMLPAETDRLSSEINKSVMSPYCPGITLSDCASPDAKRLRDEIRLWLGQGLGQEQVMQRLQSRYGHSVRGQPEISGFGFLAWFMPAGVIFIGSLLVLKSLNARKSR
ncbi:cytochrome c-type biogenesis protein CcmH [bacterium]|nr:cytochrome c-type biogenesis protein CcmH [bacterium]